MTVNQTTIGARMRQVLGGRWIGSGFAVAAATGLLGVAAATVAPSAAFGGQWMRTTCTNPDGSPAGSDGWSTFAAGNPPFGSVSKSTCGPNDPMAVALAMPFAAHPPDAEVLVYTPPDNSMLVGGTLSVGITAEGTGDAAAGSVGIFTPNFVGSTDNLLVLCGVHACVHSDGSSEATPYVGTVELPHDRGGSIYLAAACTGSKAGTCSAGGYNNKWWSSVAVSSANVLLTTTSPLPTAADFRGSLLEADAHGTAGLAFTADDGGPGIYKVVVTIDGAAVYDGTPNTNAGRCVSGGTDSTNGALYFQWQQPCLRSQTVDLAIRTTTLADGPHELKVTLLNAAQDSATVLRRTITTKNLTTVSSTGTSDRRAPGAPGSPPPEYAVVLDPPTSKLTRGVKTGWAKSGLRLAGTLRNTTGLPAPGVLVTLFARNGAQAAPAAIARATTDPAGHWVLTAPRGPSRWLAIVYGEQPDAASPKAIRIRQTVKPGLTLRVQALGRGRLRFSGKLSVMPLGSPRPLVVVQTRTRNGRNWQAVGTAIRVKPSGAYTVVYDGGRNVIGGTYSFRTVANATSLFSTGISPIRRKAVR
jgi:hypothetical protein